jgi:hypothetical protein
MTTASRDKGSKPTYGAARWFGASRRAGVLIPRTHVILPRIDRCL